MLEENLGPENKIYKHWCGCQGNFLFSAGSAARDTDWAKGVDEGHPVSSLGQVPAKSTDLEEQKNGCHQQRFQ